MAEFVCKVGDATGNVFQQLETAQSETEARQKLADRGFYVYAVRPNLTVAGLLSGFRSNRKLPTNDFLIFNQQFNTLIKAGLPILKALDLLADRAAQPKIRPLLSEVRAQVREGELLSDAFKTTECSRGYTSHRCEQVKRAVICQAFWMTTLRTSV